MSCIGGVANLGLAAIFTAVLGFSGAMFMWLLVPETLRRGRLQFVKANEEASATVEAYGRGQAAKAASDGGGTAASAEARGRGVGGGPIQGSLR